MEKTQFHTFESKSSLGPFNSVSSGACISRIIKSIVESLYAGLKKKPQQNTCLVFFFYISLLQECSEKKVMEYNHKCTLHASYTLLNHIEFEKRNNVLFYISLNQAWLH